MNFSDLTDLYDLSDLCDRRYSGGTLAGFSLVFFVVALAVAAVACLDHGGGIDLHPRYWPLALYTACVFVVIPVLPHALSGRQTR